MTYGTLPIFIDFAIFGCKEEREAFVAYEFAGEERSSLTDPGAPEHFAITGVEIAAEDKYHTVRKVDLLPILSESYVKGLEKSVLRELKESVYG